MPALKRTIALAEMDSVALAVPENLKLYVARVAEIFFEIDGVVAERCFRFGAGLFHQRLELFGTGHDLHAASATAGCRLDEHRIADPVGDRFGFGNVVDSTIGAGDQWQAESASGALGLHLVAHRANMLGLWPHEDNSVSFHDLGKLSRFPDRKP